jgi:AmmeMemoRadiSam system protein A
MNILLKIARASILEQFEGKTLINKKELIKEYPFLKEKRATFVTLKIENRLRGCIGSILPRMTLIDDVIYNAKEAAFSDPRFSPLTKEEYDKIKIEISLLTIPQKLEYKDIDDLKDKIIPHKHGVILALGGYQATFLPSVWEELPKFELFFGHLCQKASMREDCLKYSPTIYTYETQTIKEI